MIFDVFSAVLLLASQATPAITTGAPEPWGEFSRRSARGLGPDIVALGTVASPAGAPNIHWARRSGAVIATTDSIRYPALVGIVDSIKHIEPPSPVPGNPELLIGDGTSYSISVHSAFRAPHASNLDRITIESGGEPLATWVDQALDKLQDCWLRS